MAMVVTTPTSGGGQSSFTKFSSSPVRTTPQGAQGGVGHSLGPQCRADGSTEPRKLQEPRFLREGGARPSAAGLPRGAGQPAGGRPPPCLRARPPTPLLLGPRPRRPGKRHFPHPRRLLRRAVPRPRLGRRRAQAPAWGRRPSRQLRSSTPRPNSPASSRAAPASGPPPPPRAAPAPRSRRPTPPLRAAHWRSLPRGGASRPPGANHARALCSSLRPRRPGSASRRSLAPTRPLKDAREEGPGEPGCAGGARPSAGLVSPKSYEGGWGLKTAEFQWEFKGSLL